jgi:multiple sugar transport system substrate-binding protein
MGKLEAKRMKRFDMGVQTERTGARTGYKVSGVRFKALPHHPFRVWFLVCCSVLLILSCSLGCERAEQTEERPVRVALPQWFYPSKEAPWLEKAWQRIRQENPGRALSLDLVPGRTEQVKQKLMVVHASGEGPDLASIRLEWVPTLVAQGILQPIEDGLSDVWETMLPALHPAVEHKGKRYIVPYDIGVRVILYRSDLFEEAGLAAPSPTWTWNELVAGAKRLTRDLDGDGTIDRWGFGIPAARSRKTILHWLPWFWSLGGNLQEEDGQVNLSTQAAVAAMQWYRDLAHRYRVTPPTLYSMDQDTVFQGMASGLFAITEGGSWEIAMLAKHSPHGEKIGIAPLPRPRLDGSSTTLIDGWGFGILTQDRQKQSVLARLLSHLCSAEHQLAKYRASGMLSPFEQLYQAPVFTETREGKVLAAALHDARPAPSHSSFTALSEALEIALQKVLMDGTRPGVALAEQDQLLRKRQTQSR